MTGRRLNLKLLAILLVSTLVVGGLVHVLHKFQVDRNAGALLTLAEQAESRDELRKAASYLRTYVNFRPLDEQGYVRWANLVADMADLPTATPKDLLLANSVLETATLKSPEDRVLRRRMVDVKLKIGRLRDARENLELLVRDEPENMDNQVLLAQCLIAEGSYRSGERRLESLIGYDATSGTFDPQSAPGARHVAAYVTLAELLRTYLEAPEQADQVMNQLVAVNSYNFQAQLDRGNYLLRHGQTEAAAADIQRALEMAPEEADVLLAASDLEATQLHPELARKHLEIALKKYPDQSRIYRAMANLELVQFENPPAALGYIEQGLKATKDERTLLSYKAELQLRSGELSALNQTLEAMVAADLQPEIISFYRARRMLANKQWIEGARELERLRPLIARSADRQTEVNLYLGLCYERLGQPDRALEAYGLALRADARQQLAREGIERVQRATGVLREPASSDGFAQRVAAQMKLPQADREWKELDEQLEKHIREQKLSETAATLLWARMLGLRGEYVAAEQLLTPVLEKHPQDKTLWLMAVELARADTRRGVEQALALATQAEQAAGDNVELRLLRGVLLFQRDGRNASLTALEEKLQDFSAPERRRLLAGFAELYLYAQRWEDVRRCWEQIAEQEPNDLAIRLQLLELALQENSLEELETAQRNILALVKTQQDSAWQYAEAGRLSLLAARESNPAPRLKQALLQLDAVLKARPQWNLAHALRARVLLQQEKFDDAIAAFQRAFEFGSPRPSDVRQLVQLLSYRGRFAEAQKLLTLSGDPRYLGLGSELQAEIYLRSGDTKQGLQLARQTVLDDPKSALKLLWYGQVLIRAGELEEATNVLQRAVEAAPEMPQVYVALLALLAQQKQPDQAREVLNQANQKLAEDQRTLVLARGEELLGNSAAAEKYYQQALAAMPESTVRLRALASFYLTGGYAGLDGAKKALPIVQQVLSAPQTGLTAGDDTAWARRTLGMLRAAGGTYPDLVAALALIEQNGSEGHLGREDQMQAALILARRPEAVSRRRAVRYLQELQDAGELPVAEQLVLADLYNRFDDWEHCRSLMLQVVAQQGNEPLVLATFTRLLVEHNQLDQAQRYVDRLVALDAQSPATQFAQADLLARRGKPEEAAAIITKNLPATPAKSDLPQLGRVYRALQSLKLYSAGEQVLRKFVELDPESRLALVDHQGFYGNVDEAFSLLKELEPKLTSVQLAQTGLNILRSRRTEIGNRYDAQVQHWLDLAEQKAPDSSMVLQLLGQMADLQGNYEAEARSYRALLAKPDVKGNLRGLVLNNLAFNLALRKQPDEDVRRLVDEAIEIYGATGGLLDTRAMVSLSLGETERAISDLNLAISDEAKPTRLFHLALAHLAAGNKDASLRAYREAERRGLLSADVTPLERPHLDRLVRELGVSLPTAGT